MVKADHVDIAIISPPLILLTASYAIGLINKYNNIFFALIIISIGLTLIAIGTFYPQILKIGGIENG